jgi:hypothetical protein
MTNKTFFYVSSLVIIPAFFVLFYGARLLGRIYAIDQWMPKWDILLIILRHKFRLKLRGIRRW